MSESDVEILRRLEEGLWRPETRFDHAWLESVLAPDFVEFGRSSRVYVRAEVLATPPAPIPIALPLPSFRVRWIAPDVALVTYQSDLASASGRERALRSSLWTRSNGRWQLRFHQGTPIGAAHAEG